MENIADLAELLRIPLILVPYFYEAGEYRHMALCCQIIGPPLGWPGFAVVEPHLLLWINQYPIALAQNTTHQRHELLFHITCTCGYGDGVGVIHQEAKKACHGEIGFLADNIQPLFPRPLGQRPDYGAVQRIEVIAGNDSAALQPCQVIQARNLCIAILCPPDHIPNLTGRVAAAAALIAALSCQIPS